MRVKWTEAEDAFLKVNYSVLPREDIARKLLRTVSSCVNRAVKIGVLRKERSKYSHDRTSFSKLDLDTCYWAGLLAADGCLRERGNSRYVILSLKKEDVGQVGKLSDFLKYTGPLKFRKSHGFPYVILELCGCNEVFDNLVDNFNITPKKSLTLKPPKKLKENQRLAFIAGLLDGDGTVRRDKKGRLEISCVGTVDVLEWMKDILDELVPQQGGFNSKVRVRNDRGSNYACYKFTGFRAEKIAGKVLDLNLPLLPRKWDKTKISYVPKGGSAVVWAKRFAA